MFYKTDVVKLTAKPRVKASLQDNICHSFEQAGVYPFNANVVTSNETAPATNGKGTPETENNS